MLSSLSDDVALLRDAGLELTDEDRERLDRARVTRHEPPVRRVEEHAHGIRVVFDRRTSLSRHALFVQPVLSLACDLAGALGVAVTETGAIETDDNGQTIVPGVYAAGDAAATMQSVAIATASGARAAAAINAELLLEDTAPRIAA